MLKTYPRRIFLNGFIVLAVMLAALMAVVAVPGAAAQENCPSPYVVQRGDTLSEIALQCGTTVQALLEVNPEIENASLIYPGQRLELPEVLIPDTGDGAQVQLTPERGPAGTTVEVVGTGFSANTTVLVGPGVRASEPVSTNRVSTDEQGRFVTEVTIPESAEANRDWVVAANTLGQGDGLSAIADFTVLPADDADQQVYTVQRGDTLSEIAAQFDTSVQALLRANPEIEDPSLIIPGQELVIPGGLIIPDTGERIYIVERGDTLSEIAVRFGTTVDELLASNPAIEDPSLIVTGQRLIVPQPVDIIPDTGQTVYVVQAGDNLSEIAFSFRTTVDALLEANPEIDDPRLIFPGQRIVIPNRD